MSLKHVIIFLLFIPNIIICENQTDKERTLSVDQKWITAFDEITSLVKKVSLSFLPAFEHIILKVNISSNCSNTLRKLLTDTEEEWVLSMLESSGRLPEGLLSGTITSYGDYDQCVGIRGISDGYEVNGKYCFLNIRPPLPPVGETLNLTGSSYENSWINEKIGKFSRMYARIANGICIPSVCDENEVTQVMRNVFSELKFSISVEHCSQLDDKTPLDFAQILSIACLSLCILAVIIGTVYDECSTCETQSDPNNNSPNDNNLRNFFLCFSFMSNAKRIFTINDNNSKNSENELKFLHGLRVISIFWVILCHTTNFAPLGLYDQPLIAARFKTDGVNVVKHLWTQLIISGSLSVQTFFIISGLISLHTALKYKKSSGGFSYLQFVLLRWLRLAPPLFGMFCYQFVWPLLGSGPIFHKDFLKYGLDPCYNNWLPSFLFISNWWPLVDQCASQTWYLSADFQINLVAYFVIIYYLKNYANAIKLNVWLIICGILLPTIINYLYSIPLVHILDPDSEKLSLSFNMIEFNTYNHLLAYFTGVLIAGLINSGKQIQVPKNISNILWPIFLSGLILTPFSTYPFIQMDDIPASNLTLLYTSVKRIIWVSGIAWIAIACSTFDKNGIVSKFLSAKLWQPFSRLTFSIYLTQSLVVWYHGYQSRHLYPIDHYNALFRVGGVTMFSLIFGFILHMLFEAPSVNLCKLIFTKSIKSREINNNEEMVKLDERIDGTSLIQNDETKQNDN